MNEKWQRFLILALALALASFLPLHLAGQQGDDLEGKLQEGMNTINTQVKSIGSTACGLIGAIIGLVSLGRAAWKFANGDQGSVMSLLEGVLAIVLAQISGGFFAK